MSAGVEFHAAHTWSHGRSDAIGYYGEAKIQRKRPNENSRRRPEWNCRETRPSPLWEAVRQPGGKQILCWAVEADCDPDSIRSNLFSIEWPPKSGKQAQFPEVDRAGWFSMEEARKKLLKGQLGFSRCPGESVTHSDSNGKPLRIKDTERSLVPIPHGLFVGSLSFIGLADAISGLENGP